MQVLTRGTGRPVVGVVACIHGNEPVGKEVIDLLQSEPIKGTQILLLANEEAMQQDKRYIDVDLNRCFPGDINGRHEERLAVNIKEQLADCDFVIDIHSTKGETEDFSIFTQGSAKILAEAMPLNKIVRMEHVISKGCALIDHVSCGISIEFSKKTSADTIKKMIVSSLQNLDSGKKIDQELYSVYGIMMKDETDIRQVINFKKTSIGKEVFYPVLFGEPAYETVLCFKARKI